MLHNRWMHRHLVYPGVVALRGEQRVFSTMRRLREIEQCTPERMREHVASELRATLQYAATHCVYYRDKLSDLDWRVDPLGTLPQLPTIDKLILQRAADQLRASPLPPRTTAKTTGGSTGQPVTVLKDRNALAMEMAASWLGYGWFGVSRGDRAVRFWGDPFTWKRRLRYAAADFAMNRLRMSAFAFDDADLENYWERCVEFAPDYFYGYASMLAGFARYVRASGHEGRRLGLKVIISTSEVLGAPQRTLLEDVFGCPVQDEYGCGEVGPVAYSCENGALHVMSGNVVLEVLRADGTPAAIGEPGELVITDLHNRAMPLIRYRVGDFGAWGTRCACGRAFPVLERIYGREYDFVLGRDGRRFHGEFFLYIFEELRTAGFPLDQFQVVQTSWQRIRVDVVTANPVGDELRARLRARVEEHLPGIDLEVRQVPAVARASSGKMRLIINEVVADRVIEGTYATH